MSNVLYCSDAFKLLVVLHIVYYFVCLLSGAYRLL